MSDNRSLIDYIDYTSISFPSDRITVRDIRKAHPDLIDVEGDHFFGEPEAADTVGNVILLERLLARAAFEAALGKSGNVINERGLSRADCLEDLAPLYATYGVASGPEHTEQLVRDFEAQAAAQAKGQSR